MSLIESAPATMPATRVATFAAADDPAAPDTLKCSSTSSRRPARSARASIGTSPADDTKPESSNRADRTAGA
jgi:hypothetical protein